MRFNSLEYIVFLPATILIFHILPGKYKQIFLLLTGYFFYGWLNLLNLPVLLFTTGAGYVFAILIKSSEKNRNILLFTGILINIIILISFREIFKNFVSSIGISFFTLQNISYLIDCYLEVIEPERNIFYYALYLSFFPKLLQGPIERSSSLMPQIKGKLECKYENLLEGSKLIAWGMFKKIVIADNISVMVNGVMGNINGSNGAELLMGVYFYAIQIYCDFSGYTDIALGSARMFGIILTDNFNYPYFANSVQDFWRRWHISLSKWLLDYIFKPLQMKWRNYGSYGTVVSLVITFLICGIWHGLTLNYIVWGVYHGILISISFLTYKKYQKFCKKCRLNQKVMYVIDMVITFHLICFSWIIFMTKNLSDTVTILEKILHLSLSQIRIPPLDFDPAKYFYICTGIFIMIEIFQLKFDIKSYFYKRNLLFRWALYYILVMSVILLGNYGTDFSNPAFMYFKF